MADTFKAYQETPTELEGMVALGGMAEAGHPAVIALVSWAERKEEDLLKEFHALAVNPAVGERLLGICIGEMRSLRKDVSDYLRVCVKRYKDSKKEKKT